jgi:DNA polymerase I-like protein with 3'-5' exonuclease and polymerase domains
VIDLETSIKNRGPDSIGNNKADPFVQDNQVVWTGIGYPDNGYSTHKGALINELPEDKVIVGQNIKFDLHYLMREPKIRKNIHRITIWDTQLAEYLLTGQQSKMISLDKLAEKYGGTLKDDRIKEYWNADIDTEDIPDKEIEPYLVGDLENTKLVYQGQLERAKELDMLPLIEAQMRALLATTEMEFNGMYFNRETAMIDLGGLLVKKSALEKQIVRVMESVLPAELVAVPNPESKDHLSVLLFGGNVKYKKKVNVLDDDGVPVKFKSGKRVGQIKTKMIQDEEFVRGLCHHAPAGEWETKKAGIYSTDENVLKYIIDNEANRNAVDFCEMLLEFRTLSKEIGTYYGPYISLVHEDGCIHGKLLHTNTSTGRLSSQSPNLQNITNEE